jgi:hypothetical protein
MTWTALSRQTPYEEQRYMLPASLAGELTSNDAQTVDSLSLAARAQKEGRSPEPCESYLWPSATVIRPLHLSVSGIYAYSVSAGGGPICTT